MGHPVTAVPAAPAVPAATGEFNHLDADFIRVVEDLIDVLIQKGVLRVTDLPVGAQRKLAARKHLRGRLSGALDLLDRHDGL